ncbi:hypothetical protein N7517_009488 [Penicillium concentricum]|uniref:Uncharacterized protein n=1 Tax=Penicillium concentricum TaxID=293559 RepID=A0A9W9UWU1_9EURO|nr:uncharacterized protein N7517_009488 [Penicillium concentricum]KAJ5360297.1 hypothetical protein N7517_009488 [Penicillium concentricum]
MATHQGPSRRNGVIGFNMTGPPAPATPMIAPRRNGPIGFQMVPGPASNATPSLNNQGPPHRITPLVGPDTAHYSSFEQTTVQPSQSQPEISALGAQLKDAEATISRHEMELGRAKSQLSALQSQTATQRRTTCFVDQQQMDALINQSRNSRSRDVDSQLRVLENRLDEAAEELERAEGNIKSLQACKQSLAKDQTDLQELRQLLAATEHNMRRQERVVGAESRFKGLLKTMERMLASSMQNARASQVQTRSAPIAESKTNPVGIAHRTVMGSQQLGSQGHAFDHHPRQLDKGKERGPRSLPPEERECDKDMISDSDESDLSSISPSDSLSNVMALDSRNSSRDGSPMSITLDPTEQVIAARMLQADESQMGDQMVQGAPVTTLTTAPQQVETYDMMQNKNQLAYFEHAKLNGQDFDGYMEWEHTDAQTIREHTHVQTIRRYKRLDPSITFARRKHRSIFKGKVAAAWASTTHARGRDPRIKRHRLTGVDRRQLTNGNPPCYTESPRPRLTESRRRITERRRRLAEDRRRLLIRSNRLSVRLTQTNIVNLPVRKRLAGLVKFGEDEEPSPKKQITKEIVEANGSLSLPISEVYVMNTAPKVPEMSVSAVSQPAQSVHVSTEEVPTQTVMSEPAVSQPTQTVLEYTETVSTEQVPTAAAMSALAVPQPTQVFVEATEQVPIDEGLSEPAVSQPTQADSQENETVEIMQVPTEAVTSEPAVPEPSQTALEATLHESSVLEYTMLASTVSIPSDEVVDAPAPSEPAPTESAQTEPSSTEKILSAPAVIEPTLNESDLTWQTEGELVVPGLRTGTRSRLNVVLARRAAGTRARPTIMSSSGVLQVTAAPRVISTSSLVASPEDASANNAVATGTDSRAGVSKGTKRVEDAENPTRSARQSAGEQREEMCGKEAATSGLQMPGAWPSDLPAVTASGESDMQEGSALLRGLWTGAGRLSFGVFAMVMVILLSFPLWAGHLGHLVYALEGPEQFLEELRWEHGYDVPFMERIIFVFLRCFAGDRTLFG